jgi:chromosomal replication initiator protein
MGKATTSPTAEAKNLDTSETFHMNMAAVSNLWDQALIELRTRVDEEHFDTWLRNTRFDSLDDATNTLHLNVPSALNRSWLTRNKQEIAEVIERIADRPIQIDFHIRNIEDEDEKSEAPVATASPVAAPVVEIESLELNPKYNFENYVVGESNRFAFAACRAVAEPDTDSWNPLLIWGGVGLGKTHLLQAIAHTFLSRSPGSRVKYVNSEQFMNGFIEAIQQDRVLAFREMYRQVDLLLLDDVQFLFGKEGTQNEFFHTFNELHGNRKKIVLSSDRPPSEMANIEERLRSRFEWGLIVDIQAPDLETRVAILHQKTEMEGMSLPKDVALFLAERITTNVRKLEGVLTSLRHHCAMTGEPINIENARRILGHFTNVDEPQRVSVEHIQSSICEYFDVSLNELIGKERHKKLTFPRHLAMYLCRLMTNLSYPEIAGHFNGRNHTSILHACRKIEKDLAKDTNLQNLTNYLMKKIKGEVR